MSMVYTIEQLKERIAPLAVKYDLPAVYVFGSYARGEATENSDVDILIDKTGSTIKSLFDRAALYNDLNETLSKNVDLITISGIEQDDVKKRTPWFVENLNRERIAIYERQ
jgi:predicted nucleotidyltransferase